MFGRYFVPLRRSFQTTMLLLAVALMPAFQGACAADYSEEHLQQAAAVAGNLAHAVRGYARKFPEQASKASDTDLVKRAADHDPSLLAPYKDFLVKGRPEGVILVCDIDGTRGFFEDAACTDIVDAMRWSDPNVPCQFMLDVAAVCGVSSR